MTSRSSWRSRGSDCWYGKVHGLQQERQFWTKYPAQSVGWLGTARAEDQSHLQAECAENNDHGRWRESADQGLHQVPAHNVPGALNIVRLTAQAGVALRCQPFSFPGATMKTPDIIADRVRTCNSARSVAERRRRPPHQRTVERRVPVRGRQERHCPLPAPTRPR